MTTQIIDKQTKDLEIRVEILEQELKQIKGRLSPIPCEFWWLNVVGSAENDPTFDECDRLGSQWRQSVKE